jgi:hypothetical protein
VSSSWVDPGFDPAVALAIAAVPQDVYDEYLALCRQAEEAPTTAGLLGYAERIRGASARKSIRRRGRPLGAKALAIREAVADLAGEQRVMTVRGIFYALVSRSVVPKDEKAGYRPVQKQVLAMRREGLLRWDFVSDATRWMRKPASHACAEDALAAMAQSYRRDLWQSQGVRVEVWLEKDALAGVLVEETRRWDVPLMVSRGTSSETFLHAAAAAAQRAWEESDTRTVVLALYDYDAGGARASRSVERGLSEHVHDAPVEYRQIAVTRAQVEEWSLPTRPAKRTDPEYESWAAKYGSEAVELDAIPPHRLLGLVRDAIVGLIDLRAWEVEQTAEEEERRGLKQLTRDRWRRP